MKLYRVIPATFENYNFRSSAFEGLYSSLGYTSFFRTQEMINVAAINELANSFSFASDFCKFFYLFPKHALLNGRKLSTSKRGIGYLFQVIEYNFPLEMIVPYIGEGKYSSDIKYERCIEFCLPQKLFGEYIQDNIPNDEKKKLFIETFKKELEIMKHSLSLYDKYPSYTMEELCDFMQYNISKLNQYVELKEDDFFASLAETNLGRRAIDTFFEKNPYLCRSPYLVGNSNLFLCDEVNFMLQQGASFVDVMDFYGLHRNSSYEEKEIEPMLLSKIRKYRQEKNQNAIYNLLKEIE